MFILKSCKYKQLKKEQKLTKVSFQVFKKVLWASLLDW